MVSKKIQRRMEKQEVCKWKHVFWKILLNASLPCISKTNHQTFLVQDVQIVRLPEALLRYTRDGPKPGLTASALHFTFVGTFKFQGNENAGTFHLKFLCSIIHTQLLSCLSKLFPTKPKNQNQILSSGPPSLQEHPLWGISALQTFLYHEISETHRWLFLIN